MARINGTSAKNGYGFYAVLTDIKGENYLNTNTTTVKYEVYIVNGSKRTDSNGWTFNAKIDGSDVYDKTSQNLKTNDTDYNEAKLLFSGTKDIKHNTDGSKSITFSSTLSKSSYSSYDPGKCSLSGTFKLTDIPRASTLIPANTNVSFGSTIKIDINRNVDSYTDTITWVGYIPKDNGDGSYDLMNGTPSSNIKGTIIEKTSVNFIEWQIPDELSSLIPFLRTVGVKLICTTYNGNTLIGTTEKWLFVRTNEEDAKPLVSYTKIETNGKVINQIGNNEFDLPVLNVSQPQFTFNATPRYNATIKSLKIICDDGQTGTISPHIFKPIGSAKFSIVAVDSREYTTTIPVDLSANAIPYIIPTIKTLEVSRFSPISGEIIINASGSWYGGTMIDDIANPLYTDYKCKIRDENGDVNLINIPESAVKLYEATNQWYIENYNLGSITQYNKNYDFTLIIGDYYYTEIQLSKLIRKGVPTFDYGEHDLKVNGDLFVADEDGLNKEKINVSGKVSKNLFNKNNITNGRSYADDGTHVQLSNAFIQESYIPVESSTSYTFSTEEDLSNVENGRTVIMEYDDNYNFIKRTLAAYNGTLTITTTSNTKYTRLGGSSIGLETYQFEKGNKRTSYEEYYEPTLLIKCSNGAWISFNVNFLVD